MLDEPGRLHDLFSYENDSRKGRFRGLISPDAKRRERGFLQPRALTNCAVSSWESEELDERLHARFLTAARKSLGFCVLGDTMEARPKQLR